MSAPSNKRSSMKIFRPLIARVDFCVMAFFPLTLLFTPANVTAHFGFHSIRGQTSTSCWLNSSITGSLTSTPACERKQKRLQVSFTKPQHKRMTQYSFYQLFNFYFSTLAVAAQNWQKQEEMINSFWTYYVFNIQMFESFSQFQIS